MGRGQGEHRGCGLIEAANQEFPAVPPKPIYVPRGRWSVGCLVVASKLRPTVSVPHCSGPVDSTMSVTNSVDATRPRASNVVYTLPPSSLVEEHSSKISSFGPYLLRCYLHFSRRGRFNRSKEFYPD